NIVEGITDLLACQAVLRDWVDADPDSRKHVVLSAGGCTYHPKPEWMQHFAGKEMRVWFDVGDKNNEGQVGAAVWAAAVQSVAGMVRNCPLPLSPKGGKNDLRAWLVGDEKRGLRPNNYADMCEFAETFKAVEPSEAAAGLTPGDAILANLGINVI